MTETLLSALVVAFMATTAVTLWRSARSSEEAARRINELQGRAEEAESWESVSVRLAAALGRVTEGVVVSDEEGRIVYRNEQAAEFIGARHAEALAEQAVTELLAQAAAGTTGSETLDLYGPPRRTLTIAAAPLDDGERAVGAVARILDITELRRLEAMRRDFVANISHELKTPIGALGLLAETIINETDPTVASRLSSRMHSEALRVGRIIDDLLDLSRIESEESPRREPVVVASVVADAVERVRRLADHRGIPLEVGDADPALTVIGDSRQLISAVHNLVENAIKYSETASPVTVRVVGNGTTVDIVVKDRGIGIPAHDLERVFERFYRVDRARSRDTGGTGLGLAIVRHVAGNHGGDVLVSSQEGKGSTFTLRLPAGQGVASAPDGGAG